MKPTCLIALASLTASVSLALLATFSEAQPVLAQGSDASQPTPLEAQAPTADPNTAPDATKTTPAADDGLEHPGLKPFQANCSGCHSIGLGDLTGPDLMGLKERIPNEAWFASFVKNPGAMAASDAYAKSVNDKFDANMPPQSHLSDAVIADLMDFIFRGGPGLSGKKLVIDRSPANIALGRAYFTGEQRFASGGPSCFSCHTTDDIGGLGGGSMAGFLTPAKANLTSVHSRLGGDLGVAAMLGSPQFLVMRDIYARHPLNDQEINALTAYFSDLVRQTPAKGGGGGSGFLIYGVAGAIILLLLTDILWLKRFRGVRRPMVEGRGQ